MFFAQETAPPLAPRDVVAFYELTNRRPVWVDAHGRPTPAARTALAHLRAVQEDGLDPDDYRGTALEAEATALEQNGARTPDDATAFDLALTTSVLRFMRDLHVGRLDPREMGFDLDHIVEPHDFPALLQTAIADASFDQIVDGLRPRFAQYAALKRMLVKHLPSDPVRSRRIALAMERLRWLPELSGQRLIVVNIPMFHLWAFDADRGDGASAIDMAVIIGRADAGRTPVFASRMTAIVINPYWNVPDSIARNEILPRLARNRNYLARNHMEMIGDGSSRRIRQVPGPWNALGRLKFEFPNLFSVYLHGTPAPKLFRKARRDFSHGCIRVEDPERLAEWVLSDQSEWSRARLRSAIAEGATRTVPVAQPPHIVMFYLTAMVVPGESDVTFADDIYGHDARLEAWLKEKRGFSRAAAR